MKINGLVKTLVFFDLETTGLPSPKKIVNCTEICLVAVHRKHFDDRNSNFRVVNKITLCIQPQTSVESVAASLTGLNNKNLETQQKFSTSTAHTLVQFLSQLEQPICLLAHNGSAFDFPLLKAEMQNAGETLPSHLLCLDTRHALIDILPPLPTNNDSFSPKRQKTSKYFQKGYTLRDLYERLIGVPLSAEHGAEVDTVALLKVCHKVEKFAKWMDKKAVPLY